MNDTTLTMEVIYNIVPFFIKVHGFQKEVVRRLRFVHILRLVAPKVFRVHLLKLKLVVKLSVIVYGKIGVYPRSIYLREF